MLLKRFLFLILIFIFSAQSRAAELYEGFQSIRQLGMGGVYVFDPKDAGAYNKNPAYTCYSKGLNWEILNLGFGINGLSVYDKVQSAGNITGIADLAPFYGTPIWFGIGGYTSFTIPCFGVSFFNNGFSTISLNNPAFPVLNLYAQYDYGYSIGGAVPLGSNLSLGISAKRVDRRGGPISLGVADLTSISNSALTDMLSTIQNEGVGYGFDTGIVSRFEELPFNPTFSLAWQDVGSTRFQKIAGTAAPDTQKDNLTLGMTIDGEVPLLGFSAGLEYRHITDASEQLGKKLHLGTELSLAMFDLRAGFYQGYTTYGVGMDVWLLDFDAAMYSVEKGAYAGQTPDQRIQMSLSMDLSFDPDFHLTEVGGKHRRLKQRR